MLEKLLIFTKGGLILWGSIGSVLKGSPIETLIRSCLLEERGADRSYRYDTTGASYTCKWSFHNELGLVFVAVYQQFLQLMYVDELLSMVKSEFAKVYAPKRSSYPDFENVYRRVLRDAQIRSEELRRLKQQVPNGVTTVASNGNTAMGQGERESTAGGSGKSDSSSKGDADSDADGNGTCHVDGKVTSNGDYHGDANGKTSSDEEIQAPGTAAATAFNMSKLKNLKSKKAKAKAKVDSSKPKAMAKGVDSSPIKLDFTVKASDSEVVKAADLTKRSGMDADDEVSDSDEEDENEDGAVVRGAATAKKGWFSSVFQSVTGKAALEKSDLEPALKVLKERFMAKNVAEEIAEKLCESVCTSLIGKKLGTFSFVSSTVKKAMEEALQRILTPKRSIDILREVKAAQEEGRPYVIVFVGVNGVGKSTNLSKVAYWLLQHEMKVMMAACDTFRAGAVEQLKTHAAKLDIPLYSNGYGKDPARVAAEAVADAKKRKADVLLVDTAGRMQDNEPLMAALSRLISTNKPDLVLFVGEALVGNEAVDQLTKFNQKLADKAAKGSSSRVIDGILLTKFDTIDDKVGAALSMVYVSGAPVMFVGVGQDYHDLSRLNVKSIIKTLLK